MRALERRMSWYRARIGAGTFLHNFFTGASLRWRRNTLGGPAVDIIYLLTLAALYGVTHGLVWALGRLGRPS